MLERRSGALTSSSSLVPNCLGSLGEWASFLLPPCFSFYPSAVCNVAVCHGTVRSLREQTVLFISVKDQANHSFLGTFFFVCKRMFLGGLLFHISSHPFIYLVPFPFTSLFSLHFLIMFFIFFYLCYFLVTIYELPFSFLLYATDATVPIVFPSGDVWCRFANKMT